MELGMHLLLDGIGCNVDGIDVESVLRRTLVDVPLALGLTRVSEPQLFSHDHNGDVAGLVLLAESHLSIHVRPRAALLHADLFSCRSFDSTQASALVKEAFSLAAIHERVLVRGQP